ncbi:alpha-ketoglutarate-dependent dioxygenase AlkB [Caenimonas aquaedulcis]|uniref:Alpha-ketoglutarate-dependent dioxygenase AlkB n=1 Tax=Caenimonas aquaedulcis TaxID=2793270 RepID=A0A931MIV2_9BURK|nr:alpha-ketoglutarate-dependent dioxygenase AlkB [Caenimonas aquaedulcis]MBG9390407.1 alpha-ketoglutarate-dependent dioxygenase AlkB [Caenimonas aquaedulcis]
MSLFEPDGALPTEPSGLSLRDEFITPAEEQALIELIGTLPLHNAQYKQYTARRRVINFGSSYDFDENVLREAPDIPADFAFLRERLAHWLGIESQAFTQLLVAEYAPGTPLGWHRDVPDYEIVAGVSLGTRAVLRFRPYPHRPGVKAAVRELEAAPRSAYAMQGPARWEWQHSVPPTPGRRWSLTFRTRAARGRG